MRRFTSVTSITNRVSPSFIPTISYCTRKKINFDDAQEAFKSKTTADLFRALLVLRICKIRPLVAHNEKLLDFGTKYAAPLTELAVRHTFYNHFCAGESIEELKPLLEKLKRYGVGAILDYAVEADVPKEMEKVDSDIEVRDKAREGVVSARTYDYTGEDECDRNLDIFLKCLDTAAKVSDSPFAAIKLTALGKPNLLKQMSIIISSIQDYWYSNFGNETDRVDLEKFQNVLQGLGKNLSPEVSETLFRGLDSDKNGVLDYIEWTKSLQLDDLTTREKFERSGHNKSIITRQGLPVLTEHETILMDHLVSRVNKVAAAANERNVKLLIDAEQTYIQPAIEHITLNLQRKYNREKPIIFNTYQCYLTYSKNTIRNDLERSRREGFYFAGKLVRGAYMNTENRIAAEKQIPSPVYQSKQETDDNYNSCASLLLDNTDIASFMIASHNRKSIELMVDEITRRNIDPKNIYFGQLLGMSDNLSFNLGQNGYQVFKYVPYGPVLKVLPYLGRRAFENAGILANSTTELKMIQGEILRRIRASLPF